MKFIKAVKQTWKDFISWLRRHRGVFCGIWIFLPYMLWSPLGIMFVDNQLLFTLYLFCIVFPLWYLWFLFWIKVFKHMNVW